MTATGPLPDRLVRRRLGWRDPAGLAAALDRAGLEGAAVLLSDGGAEGRWSYVLAEPERRVVLPNGAPEPFLELRRLLGDRLDPAPGPPFTGGVLGLAAYDLTAPGASSDGWPGLVLDRHLAGLAFDHRDREVWAFGRGETDAQAEAVADRAAAWLDLPEPDSAWSGTELVAEGPKAAYLGAVADVIRRIGEGELYQANIAQAWTGRLAVGDRPVGLFRRLAEASAAPFAAWLALGERQLVSNSPELFLTLTPEGEVSARPIKGTRPRGSDAGADALAAAALSASPKDRAENLMIVDLMRNDLSRVCRPGSVEAPGLFEVETYANVHHLVSEIRGRLGPGQDAASLLAVAFPPGSITGAPKRKAMEVIAGREPPRGPWCGSLFLAGFDGSMSASVLIRTVAFSRDGDGWSFRTQAGAGIVADSNPQAELAETEAKIAAIRQALRG